MSRGISLRSDFSSADLRTLSRSAGTAKQARRLLALSLVYDGGSHSDAACLAGVSLQTIRDWVLRFNAEGPDGWHFTNALDVPDKHNPDTIAVKISRVEPCRKRLAVHARKLALEPDLRIL